MATKLEQLEQQLLDIQAELAELKATTQHGETSVYETPWKIVETGEFGSSVNSHFDGTVYDGERFSNDDLNAFVKEEVAQGFANAFHVMVALRQCEGAGSHNSMGEGYVVASDGGIDYFYKSATTYALLPPFPSEELARAAAESVGIDKIKAAYEFLAKGVI